MKLSKTPIILSIFLLMMPVFNSSLEIGYYTFLRLVVCGTAIYLIYFSNSMNQKIWMWITGLTALLFNPLIRVELGKDTWQVIDVIVSILFLISILILDKKIWEFIYKSVIFKWVNRVGIFSIWFIIFVIGLNIFPKNIITNKIDDFIYLIGPTPLILPICYFIYLIPYFLNMKLTFKNILDGINKRTVIREGLFILVCLIAFGVSTHCLRIIEVKPDVVDVNNAVQNESKTDFDINDAVMVSPTENDLFSSDGKVIDRYKNYVDRYIHKDSAGMSKKQILREMKQVDDNKQRSLDILYFWRNISIIAYPIYLLFMITKWVLKPVKSDGAVKSC